MDAEILAVGSELLTPERVDTNSLYLTAELNGMGVEVIRKSIVGDDRARLTAAIRESLERCDILIVTGGLGPTEDDVTRDAIAAALGRTLVFREDLCRALEARFRRFKRPMAEINKRQAYLVEGGEALENPNGSAPGQWIQAGASVIALLPGPPRELKPMFEEQVRTRLAALLPPQVIHTVCLRVACMAESDVDQLIAPVYTRYQNPVCTILASPADIQIHLRSRAATAEEAARLLAEVAPEIEALLGDRVYTRTGDPLEAAVGALLRDRGQTLAVAESCTGGMLGQRLTSVAGSSGYFAGGFITYSNHAKESLLGVDPGVIESHGPVSQPVADAMALGARERLAATWGVSITGIAGPADSGSIPAGMVVIGIATAAAVASQTLRLTGDRHRVRTLAVQNALEMLRRSILGLTPV